MATTARKPRKIRLEIYTDAQQDIRWRTRSIANGLKLHSPAEGFTRARACLHNAGLALGFYAEDIDWVTSHYGQVRTTRTDLPLIEILVDDA